VINFNGKAPALTEKKFSFDLDSDGKEDQISFVGSDSGFLAVDLNDDGLVNDGKELFGAIYLGNIDTVFSIKNQANSLQGEVKKSGLYINENGTGGVVQQINLTI
jgi:hypothetical protein